MNYKKKLVSVIMPTYKRSEKLERAIDSVLNQSYKDLELIVVNDNEPNDDFSKELIKRLKKYEIDKRFKLIHQKKHINGAVARNVGIKAAKGEYIAFLDDDDWWNKEKIKIQTEELSKLDSSWGGVSCKFVLYDENENEIGRSIKYKDGYIYKDILNLITDVATGTILLRREYIDQTGYFDEKLLRHQDLQLLVNFTYKYKLKEVDEFLHCVDVSDTQNRPNPEKIIRFKREFFNSIKPIMNKISLYNQLCIYSMHRYEIGYVYLRNKQYIKGILNSLCVLSTPTSFMLSIKKTIEKIMQKTKKK